MADIKTVKELVLLCREAKVALYIWGIPGVGKSSVVRQVAQERGIGFADFRCAQIEAPDLRGLPDKGGDGRTHFLPPGEMPAGGEGILLLDELNRAPQDVLSAAFQLVLDRAIGEYRVPEGWSIVCAGNFQTGDYQVSELDPALRDRFCHVVLSAGETTFEEWASWMTAEHGDDAHSVISFCAENLKHLEAADTEELGFSIRPSRRSWEMAVRGLQVWEAGGYSERARLEFLGGLVSRELAIPFLKHRATVLPSQLLSNGVRKMSAALESLNRPQASALMWGLVSFTKNRLDEPEVVEVLLDFAEFLTARENDLALAFCAALLSGAQSVKDESPLVHAALLTNSKLAAAVARIDKKHGRPSVLVSRLATRPRLAKAFEAVYATDG